MPPSVVVSSAADLSRIGRAPVTILVLDELNTPFSDMSFARQALVKYLLTQPAQVPSPTALLVASNTRFMQLHDYTQNRDELIALIKHHIPDYPSKMMAGRGGPSAVERMAQSLAALEQIAKASTGTPGRKNVVWVGSGFPSADLVGLDTRTADTIEAAVHNCTGMLLAARVTMYTIDPKINSTESDYIETPDDLTMAQTDNANIPRAASGVCSDCFTRAVGHIMRAGCPCIREDPSSAYRVGNRIAMRIRYCARDHLVPDYCSTPGRRSGGYPATDAQRSRAFAFNRFPFGNFRLLYSNLPDPFFP
jgi:hypothetical protein